MRAIDLGVGSYLDLLRAADVELCESGERAFIAAPEGPLDQALAAIDERVAIASSHEGQVVLLSTLGVLKGDHEKGQGSLFEQPIARRATPRARRGDAFSLDDELRLARERAQEALDTLTHADRVSARRQRARAALDDEREPSSALEARMAALEDEERALLLEDATRELAARLGLAHAWAYVPLLFEHALADLKDLRVVRTSTLGPRANDILADAAKSGALDLKDDVVVDLLPLNVAGPALVTALEQRKSVVHLSTAERAPLSGARLKDLLDLHRRGRSRVTDKLRQAAGRGVPKLPRGLLTWPEGTRVRAQPVEVDWRDALLRAWLPRAERRATQRGALAPKRAYANLCELLETTCARHEGKVALTYLDGHKSDDVRYRELLARARAVASRLAARGVAPGDRVVLAGKNHPRWPIAAFGVILRGAVLVPVDKELEPTQLEVIVKKSRPALALFDKAASERFGALDVESGNLELFTQPGPHDGKDLASPAPDALASVLFTSGTTGEPKGVMLAHKNFTALVASLSRIFEMDDKERLLSVLPLHHTFEFSCGLLLPLVAGGQIFTVDELTGERVLYALKTSRATAMVGVPALWQLLGRRVESRIQERGAGFERAARALLFANRKLNDLGLDIGKRLFFPVHKELGGELKTLISGGAALPSDVHQLFRDLGLPLAEGYGLTEAAPVLTVADSGTKTSGTVGAPIPGVEIKIDSPDASGVGEVLARGGNVMLGYFEDDAATRMSLTDDGWLRTGDLGKLDHAGKLALVGRAKDVVVTASGENIYLDDAEALLRAHMDKDAAVVLVGAPDGRGGERLALVFAGETEQDELKRAIKKLPPFSRPSVIKRYDDDDLPRTATLKVKRKEVARWLESALDDDAPKAKRAPVGIKGQRVLEAIATVTGQPKKTLNLEMRLLEDLGFDSLMWVELGAALEPHMGKLDPERLAACETGREIAALDGESARSAPVVERAPDKSVRLPGLVKRPLRALLSRAQKDLYRFAFPAEVKGRAHIPQNEACIVVANHCSHLDTGLVKFALGQYGARLRPLAAKDYFFEGNPIKVSAVKELTNLAPIDRESASGLAFDQARALVERGEVVLIFPEGTRRADGTLGDFKPLVGRLALATDTPVLPMHLTGTFEALPRGAALPKPRSLEVRIGPALRARDLHCDAKTEAERARAATERIRDAVRKLSPSEVATVSRGAGGTNGEARYGD